MKFKYLTAPLYQGLLPLAILEADISETKATCDNCLMSKTPIPKEKRYREDLKCCTFYPFIPNFAVGAILAEDRHVKGRKVMQDLIQKNQYSLPIGLVPPIKYQMAFKKRKPHDFGNIESWLCPYYDKQASGCSIWSYRGAVCTSFYCKSSYGRSGKKYWGLISDYLTYVEMALTEEALIRLDFSPRQISESLDYLNREKASLEESKSWSLSVRAGKKLWRDRYGAHEEFYIKCYEIVKGFDRRDFKEMIGELGENLQNRVLAQYRILE